LPKICWVRIDDRLIHGQVTVDWRRHLQYDEIWVVDDGVRDDPYLRDVLRMAAPAGVAVQVYGVGEAIPAWTALPLPEPSAQPPASFTASPSEALSGLLDATQPHCILVLIKSPQAALTLVERGIALAHLNIGCLAARPGSVRAFRSISLTPEDSAALDALTEHGVHITFQLTPGDAQADWPAVRQRMASGA
jgi:PTS system mannose-specific IIB component